MESALVLCYHAVGESWSAAVAPDQLRRHVEILLRRGSRPTTFAEAVTADHDGKTFALTFDDAYASVLEKAFPILERLDVPATVFVVTDFADRGLPLEWPGLVESGVSPEAAARRSLGWNELVQLADAGWEIGSHTCTHPNLTLLDDVSLERELRGSRSTCSLALGRPCRSIAYPYGQLDRRVVEAAAAAGYEAGCSLSVWTSGSLAWPRVGVYGLDSPTRFRLKISPTVLRLRRVLAATRGRAL